MKSTRGNDRYFWGQGGASNSALFNILTDLRYCCDDEDRRNNDLDGFHILHSHYFEFGFERSQEEHERRLQTELGIYFTKECEREYQEKQSHEEKMRQYRLATTAQPGGGI